MTLILFFIHVHNACYPMTRGKTDPWCNPTNETSFHCVGPNLIWSDGDRTTGDWNFKWRTVFTVKPEEFVDLWTPLVFAFAAFYTQWSQNTKLPMISKTWGRVFVFYLGMSLFSGYGYAGNFGVFMGFWTTIAFLPFVLILIGFDPSTETTVELSQYFVGYMQGTGPLLRDQDISGDEPHQYEQPSVFEEIQNNDKLLAPPKMSDGNTDMEDYLQASRSPSKVNEHDTEPNLFFNSPEPFLQNTAYGQQGDI